MEGSWDDSEVLAMCDSVRVKTFTKIEHIEEARSEEKQT